MISKARNREKRGVYIGVEWASADMYCPVCCFKKSESGRKGPATPTSQLLITIFGRKDSQTPTPYGNQCVFSSSRSRANISHLAWFFESHETDHRHNAPRFEFAEKRERKHAVVFSLIQVAGAFHTNVSRSFWVLESGNWLTFFPRKKEEDNMVLLLLLFRPPNLVML